MHEREMGENEDIGSPELREWFRNLSPQEKIAKISRGIAYTFYLGPIETAQLRSYGNIYYRIGEIESAFERGDEPVRKFPGWTGGLGNRRIAVTREKHREEINHLEQIGENIYKEYFEGSENGRLAAGIMKILALIDFIAHNEE